MLDGYSREQWKGSDKEATVMYEIAGNVYFIFLIFHSESFLYLLLLQKLWRQLEVKSLLKI